MKIDEIGEYDRQMKNSPIGHKECHHPKEKIFVQEFIKKETYFIDIKRDG